MTFSLMVDRLDADFTYSTGLARIDKKVMEREGLTVDDYLFLTSLRGREVIVRLKEPLPEDDGTGIIRLERFTKQALKAKLNEKVEAKKIIPPPVKKIILIPAVDVSLAHNLLSHIKKVCAENKIGVTRDTVLYITFPESTAGITYSVHHIENTHGIITEETEIVLEDREAHAVEGAIDVTFEDVGGLEEQIRLVREFVQLPLQLPFAYTQLGIRPPRGIIFYGPPGTGKTYLARAIANEIHARFFYINGPEIIGTYSGETEGNLRRIFNEAIHHAPSIVIIDELDAIAPKRGRQGTLSDTRAVTQLLSIMDGMREVNGVIVIGTSNRLEEIDPALRRPGRFDREIFFPPPNREARAEILEIHTREMPLAKDALNFLPQLATLTPGFVGADLMELCRAAGLNALRRNSNFLLDYRGAIRMATEQLLVNREDFEAALKQVRPSAMREVLISMPCVRWDAIGGYVKIKERLKELIEIPLKKPELFEAMKISQECGVLLYGPAGTGKTLMAKALANECGVNFIAVEGPEIFGQWLGESEEALRHIFHIARLTAPTLIFFDQIEALAGRRELAQEERTTARVVSQLLSELDGIEPRSRVMVLAATNNIDMVDPAVLRSGRFGTHIYIPLPDGEDRKEILSLYLKDAPLDDSLGSEELISYLAQKTSGFTGAELKVLCDEAKRKALKDTNFERSAILKRGHFEEALKTINDEYRKKRN